MSRIIEGITIGSVYFMMFDGDNSEQKGWRPGVVFQNNKANAYSPNIIALPCTTSLKKLSQPTHVFIKGSDCGLKSDSVVLCENPQRMSKRKIGKFITRLPDKYIKRIAVASLLSSSAISFISYDELIKIWVDAVEFNKLYGCNHV